MPPPAAPSPRVPAPRRTGLRRVVWAGGGILLAVLLAGLSLPWWLGTLLAVWKPVDGLEFARYERRGYSRFVLEDVTWQGSGVALSLDSLETDTPLLLAWRQLRGLPVRAEIGAWELEQMSAESAGSGPEGVGSLGARQFTEMLPEWLTRLPELEVASGRVDWDGQSVTVTSLATAPEKVEVVGLTYREQVLNVELVAPVDPGEWRLTLSSPDGQLNGEWQGEGAAVTGTFSWRGQPGQLDFTFGPDGWMPRTAALQAEDWDLPAEALDLDPALGRISGNLEINWDGDSFVATVTGHSVSPEDNRVPPVDVDVSANGDLNEIRLQRVAVNLPGLEANLTEPVTIDRSGSVRGNLARFDFRFNLAEQPWIEATGMLNGSLVLRPEGDLASPVDFQVEGQDLTAGRWQVNQLAFSGELAWPQLTLTAGELELPEGSRLAFSGQTDLAQRDIQDAELEGRIQPADLADWWPEELEVNSIEGQAELSGPWASPRQTGNLTAEAAQLPGLKPFNVTASWSGEGWESAAAEMNADFGNSQMVLAGNIGINGVDLDQFSWRQADQERLTLATPATLGWEESATVENLDLRGPGGALLQMNGRAGPSGALQVRAAGLESSWFQDLVTRTLPDANLTSLELDLDWNGGPLQGTANLQGTLRLADIDPLYLVAAARATDDGLSIDQVRVVHEGREIVSASGRIGVVLTPGVESGLQIKPEAPLALSARLLPQAEFWEAVRDLSGFEFGNPEANLELSGTLAHPTGEVQMQAARLREVDSHFAWPLPEVTNLSLDASVDATGAELHQLNLQVEEQQISASGRLNLTPDEWKELREEPLTVLRRNGEGRIDIPEGNLAPLARLAPNLLVPGGSFGASVVFLPGGTWRGQIELGGVSTRRLGPPGSLQEIEANLEFEGNTITLPVATARLGGQPVSLSGRVVAPAGQPASFEFDLQAENVPLARDPGLLLRADLNLRLARQNAETPRLTGTVNLRDSLLLSDLQSVWQSNAEGGDWTLPAIDRENFSVRDWQLAVAIRGDQFLRLRTALFNGTASTRLQLGGTLGTPTLTGEATVDEGEVTLPFANFDVSLGRATLGLADPLVPQIELTGSARRYGYDLKMEVTGTASDPNLQLTASPALTSEQALLMVMTGAVPTEDAQITGQRRLARLGTYLGEQLLDQLGADPNGSERLTVNVGENISRLGRETYDVRYELNDRWSVVGDYDEFDHFNAGLKWRIYSKDGGSPDEAE